MSWSIMHTFVIRKEIKTAKRKNLNNLNIKEISKLFIEDVEKKKLRGKKAYYSQLSINALSINAHPV